MTSNLVWLLLLLIWWNVLSENADQKPPQGFRYAFYEVVIPRKLTPINGLQEPHDIMYLLPIEGKGYLVHLKQKRGFVSRHLPVFTYSNKGDLQTDYPFIRDDCFYHGFVQNKPSSWVSLSTCSGGLRGLLHLENYTYEIEPIQTPAAASQHVLYRLEEKEGAVRMRCELTKKEQSHQLVTVQHTKNSASSAAAGVWWAHTRYVKLSIVIEHQLYVKFNRNESRVTMEVLNIIHISNSLYQPLAVELSIAALEIWSARNLIKVFNALEFTLDNFDLWKRKSHLRHIQNDASHLFIYRKFSMVPGKAFLGTVCDPNMAIGVESYMGFSLFQFSVIFTHELGHNLGMQHDGVYCKCDRPTCIMAAFRTDSDKFSNCSYNEYYKLRNNPCLFIPPDSDKMLKFAYCGNKVVEDGEQCDCGSPDQCKLDPCCQSNCMLRPGATCALGGCCAKCQYLPAQSLCRDFSSPCDLPEYCNGTSQWCPEDVHVQDGHWCSDDAICYHGNCTTLSEQCKMIFGNKAKVASRSCFSYMNARGDRFGNCGLTPGNYKRCSDQNILCGRIHCENVNVLPSLKEHMSIIQTKIGNTVCWSTDYHAGMEIPDIGAVRDGTLCGKNMMCINGECKSMSLLSKNCNFKTCNHRGICNSYQHCHCISGFAPPNCINKGLGGSIDSGPPPPAKKLWGRGASRAGTTGVIGFVIAVTVVGVGLGIYFSKRLRQKFSCFSGRVHQENEQD